MKHFLISPSILAADFVNLQKEVELLNHSDADWIHVDVMDGVFVPNISFGVPVCKAISEHTKKPLDVHLMINTPEKYIETFQKAGAHIITVHIEACTHLHRIIQQIKSVGCKAGVALNPHTPIASLHDIIHDLDIVCIMSVNPGFGGQTFIPHTFEKVAELSSLIQQKKANTLIEVDGGITLQNAAQLKALGANVLVAGSFIFKSEDPRSTISLLKNVT